MMDKQGSKFVFECEACAETWEDYCEDSFQDMMNRLKADSWKVTKIGSDWAHLCPKHRDTKV